MRIDAETANAIVSKVTDVDKPPETIDLSDKTPTHPSTPTPTDKESLTQGDAMSPMEWTVASSAKKKSNLKQKKIQEKRSFQFSTRVNLKIRTKGKKGGWPANHEALVDWFEAAKEHVPSLVIAPYYNETAADLTIPFLYSPSEVPDAPKLIQMYAQRYMPKSDGGDRFTNLYLKANDPLDDLFSSNDSDMAWWYQDNRTYCYEKVLPLYDKTIIIGTIQFTGSFVDSDQLCDLILERMAKAADFGKKVVIGGKVKPCKDMKISSKAFDQMIEKRGRAQFAVLDYGKRLTIETPAGSGVLAKKLLYRVLNNKDIRDSFDCVLPFRFLPDKNSISLGKKGKLSREKALSDHASVMQSMEVIRVDTIAHLDLPYTPPGSSPITLRSLILNMNGAAFGIPRKIFFWVDKAQSRVDMENGTTYLIAYEDHHETAHSVANVLCAYIHEFLGIKAAQLWFRPEATKLERSRSIPTGPSSLKKMSTWKNSPMKKSLQQ
jgi:hypothetical protein